MLAAIAAMRARPARVNAAYCDETYPERPGDRCQKPYRGLSV
jgi:hypothetical protein